MVTCELVCPQCGRGAVSLRDPVCAVCGFSAEVENTILDLRTEAHAEDYGERGAEALAEIESGHFWFRERARFILSELRRAPWPSALQTVADLGCGNGYMMQQLENAGFSVIGVDMHRSGLRIAAGRTRGLLVCSIIERVKPRQPLDAVALFDVIEHLRDDVAALRHAASLVRDGGFVIVTVPALMSLWSDYDRCGGHKRRYHRRLLRETLLAADLEVLMVRYFFSFAVPPVWLQRRLPKRRKTATPDSRRYLKPPSPLTNRLLTTCARLEQTISRVVPMPFGTSLFALARARKRAA